MSWKFPIVVDNKHITKKMNHTNQMILCSCSLYHFYFDLLNSFSILVQVVLVLSVLLLSLIRMERQNLYFQIVFAFSSANSYLFQTCLKWRLSWGLIQFGNLPGMAKAPEGGPTGDLALFCVLVGAGFGFSGVSSGVSS